MNFTYPFTHLQRLSVDFTYSPGQPGCNYLPNGDPGYPDEPPEQEITAVRIEVRDTPTSPWRDTGIEFDIDLLNSDWLDEQMAAALTDAEDAAIEAQAEARAYARGLEDWNP